jgi:glycosyltransferase involved in cell wall biosynthesis
MAALVVIARHRVGPNSCDTWCICAGLKLLVTSMAAAPPQDYPEPISSSASKPPLVSIGLPVYNGERWLPQSISSLLRQTFTDLELIICDNASNDGTEAICRRFAAEDPRVRYVRNGENIGGTANASLAFELARGEYFRWAAHDDRCEPTLLERLVAVLDQQPDVVVAISPSISIDTRGERLPNFLVGKAEGRRTWLRKEDRMLQTDEMGVRRPSEGTAPTPSGRFRELILTRGPCEASYGLIRSEVLRRTCLQMPYTGSDVPMLCDVALRGRFHVIDEPLFYKRWHGANRYRELGPGRMVWSRPSLAQTGKLSFPWWLQFWGFTSTVLRAPLPLGQRVGCFVSVARWVRIKWKFLAWDLAFAVVMATRSRDWRRRCYAPERWTEVEAPIAALH